MTIIEQLDKVTKPPMHTNVYKIFLYIYAHLTVSLPYIRVSKVNFIPEQVMKVQRRSRCITVLFL